MDNQKNEEAKHPRITIRFHLDFNVAFGDNIFLVGSEPRFGEWVAKKGSDEDIGIIDVIIGIKMRYNAGEWKYSHEWEDKINLEYKYICVAANGSVSWETIPNRKLVKTIIPDNKATYVIDLYHKWNDEKEEEKGKKVYAT